MHDRDYVADAEQGVGYMRKLGEHARPQSAGPCLVVKVIGACAALTAWAAGDWRVCSGGERAAATTMPSTRRVANLGPGLRIARIVFSPAGDTVAVARTRVVHVVRIADGRIMRVIRLGPNAGFPTCMTYSRDGKHLLVGSRDGVIREWDTLTWRLIREWTAPLEGGASPLAVGSGRTGDAVSAWGVGGALAAFRHKDRVRILWHNPWLHDEGFSCMNSAALSRDGRILAWAGVRATIGKGTGGQVYIADLSQGKKYLIGRGLWLVFADIAVSHDGQIVVGGGDTHIVEAWEPHARDSVGFVRVPGTGTVRPLTGIAISPAGRFVAIACGRGDLWFWDIGRPGPQGIVRVRWDVRVTAVAISPCGRAAAWGDETGAVYLDANYQRRFEQARAAAACNPKQVAELWRALRSDEAMTAHKATCGLMRLGDAAVPQLAELLRGASLKKDLLQTAIRQYTQGTPSQQTVGRGRILAAGRAAVPVLRAAAKATSSPHIRKKLEQMIPRVSTIVLRPAELQAVRSLRALRWAGTTRSHALLQKLARTHPDSFVGEQAALLLESTVARK